MEHLSVLPDRAKYEVRDSDLSWTEYPLDGGLPKTRREFYDAHTKVRAQWICDWSKFRYLRDFYESNAALDFEEFTIDLVVEESRPISYVAQFVPNTWRVSRAQGGVFQIEVVLQCKVRRGVFGGGAQRILRFADVLEQLTEQIRPLSNTIQTPRWMPDSGGNEWFVRPLSEMATNPATADRFTAEDSNFPGTTFCNHPLALDRDENPIDPASVSVIGYPNKTWTGPGTVMATQVITEEITFPGIRVYYIRASNGPGFVDPVDGLFKGTATLNWNYADKSALDGLSYNTAWPGLAAVNWSLIQPGDTLWVCGTYTDETLQILRSGVAGAYIKIRFDHPTNPGRIDQGRVINSAWTQVGNEWWTPLPAVSECMMYEDDLRLRGVNVRSRCRVQVQHSNINYTDNTIQFPNIRRVLTGHPIDIASDFEADTVPMPLAQNTRYYAIVVSSNWQFYSVSVATYVVKLAATYDDAINGIAIDLTGLPPLGPGKTDESQRKTFFLVFVQQHDWPFFDPLIGELSPGQYAVDVVTQRLWYRPTTGVPTDYVLRLAAETYSTIGASIFGSSVSYIKVLGGGEYGGLFGVLPKGRVGLGHQNIIEFQGGSNVVVDGMLMYGGRSGIAFINTSFGTVRNCRIQECAHHACGGEGLVGTQEPDLLLERNWISEIGNRHEFGDAQALVTNPHCDRAIFRRNFVYGLGQNIKVNNPAGIVLDGSENCSGYLNWFDFCHGKTFELGAGNGEPQVLTNVIFGNVVTRQGQQLPRNENLVQRPGVLHMVLNGLTDPGVRDVKFMGNLVAWTSIGNRAPDTLDDCGLIYQRSNNNAGFGINELTVGTHNAILGCDGPVLAAQKNPSASAWPTTVTNYNIYASVIEFAIKTSAGTFLQTWDSSQIRGLSPGYWTFDTGNDLDSELAVLDPTDTPRGPTNAELLALLTKYQEYDTYDQPTEDLIGNFPFADIVP